MIEPLGFSRYIYVVRGVGGLCLALSFRCVFYSFKSISVKLPLSPVSFVDRSGSREEWEERRGGWGAAGAGGGEKDGGGEKEGEQ